MFYIKKKGKKPTHTKLYVCTSRQYQQTQQKQEQQKLNKIRI